MSEDKTSKEHFKDFLKGIKCANPRCEELEHRVIKQTVLIQGEYDTNERLRNELEEQKDLVFDLQKQVIPELMVKLEIAKNALIGAKFGQDKNFCECIDKTLERLRAQ